MTIKKIEVIPSGAIIIPKSNTSHGMVRQRVCEPIMQYAPQPINTKLCDNSSICVAITCLFCVQTAVVALDQIEHALGLEHDANPIAGPIHYCGVPDTCVHPGGGSGHPVSHSHLGDNGTNALVGSVQELAPIALVTIPLVVIGAPGFRGLEQAAPERPPKSILDHVT